MASQENASLPTTPAMQGPTSAVGSDDAAVNGDDEHLSLSAGRIIIDGVDHGVLTQKDIEAASMSANDETHDDDDDDDGESFSASSVASSAASDDDGRPTMSRRLMSRTASTASSMADVTDRAAITSASTSGGAQLLPATSTTAMQQHDKASLGNLLQMFCDLSVDANVVIDPRGKIVTLNKAALELFKYHRWELVGKNVSTLMPPKYARVHDTFLQRYMRTRVRRIVGEEVRQLHAKKKDGTIFRIMLKVHEMQDTQGDVLFVGVVRDVSRANLAADFETLLHRLMPQTIARRICAGETSIADKYRATIGFLDICGYTKRTAKMTPNGIVTLLSEIFALFDAGLQRFDCMRIKSIGDGYMFTTTLTEKITAHAVNGALFAKFCVDELAKNSSRILKKMMLPHTEPLAARGGVATGEVIAGVVPGERLAFDCWGSTVNLASRLESTAAEKGEVVVCQRTQAESAYAIEYADAVDYELKGLDGKTTAYKLVGLNKSHVGGGQPVSKKSAKFGLGVKK